MTTYRIGAGLLTRELEVRETRLRTARLADRDVESAELEVVLDAARHRHDIEHWRWTRSGPEGPDCGYALEDFDDSTWPIVPHLHPIYHVAYEGFAWFRHRFRLPEREHGQVVTFLLGGLDDEDWAGYRVFVNGVELDSWSGSGRWREPRRLRVDPDDEHYALLRFGGENLLAVETRDLDRRVPHMPAGEDEHFFFIGWLLDQAIVTGEPYRAVRDFEVTRIRDGRELEVELEGDGLRAVLTYAAEASLLRKRARIQNVEPTPVRILDVVVENLEGDFAESGKGGRGRPVLAEDLFFGSEHPAGVNQGDGRRVRVLQMPGRTLASGESYSSADVVVGRAPAGEHVAKTFADYLQGIRPRRERRVTAYSPLGWYDYTNPADPLFELTEDLLEENIRLLEGLRARGVEFDVYMVDDWWEPTDFDSFRRRSLPSGGAAISRRLGQAGMRHGLWCATTRAVWTSHEEPGMEASVAGGVARTIDPTAVADESGQWNWDEEFAYVFNGEKRLCLASEPLRTRLRESLARHARELRLGCLKLDCAVPHCTSSEHGHVAGRHSVEPIVDAVLETVAGVVRESPDVFVVWYWGWQSPWFLAHGDLQFDKALKLEAASPASMPAPSFRHGIMLNIDQASAWAELVPLPCQDSLGVWLGNVAWANRIGIEEWQDAFLLDVARGSALVQLWGDVAMLGERDVDFLAEALRLVRANEVGYRQVMRIGGDPWRGDVYGYVQPTERGAIATLFNPSFELRPFSVEPPAPGLAAYELYPYPGTSRGFELELLPWEVRVLELLPEEELSNTAPSPRRDPRPTVRLDLSRLEKTRESGGPLRISGSVTLPEIRRHDLVTLSVRLHRDGVWWYHPEPQSLVRFHARLGGPEAYYETAPTSRSRNGPGAPWVIFKLPAGPSWSHEELQLSLEATLPDGVALVLEGWLLKAWWQERARTLAPLHERVAIVPGDRASTTDGASSFKARQRGATRLGE